MNVLEVREVGKTYGGVVALHDAELTVRAGSVHALLGENGAGKSTLIKVISGAVAPDRGTVSLSGRAVSFASTARAAASGVAVVSQELNLFPDLDVLSNLYPMREPKRGPFRDKRAMIAAAEPVFAELGLDVELDRPLGTLTLAQRQLVEIAKALLTRPRVLILDEPTSALDEASTARLLEILRALRERQVAVVFVSHILEEVMALCDEITVLRDGRTVLSGIARDELDIERVVAAMLGDKPELPDHAAPERSRADEGRGTLELRGVTVPGLLHDIDLTAAPGEVVGLAGLAGSGHTAILEVVAGLRKTSGGRVDLPDGRPVPHGLRAAIAAGVALVSGDRRRLGLLLDKPVWENMAQVRTVALGRDGLFIRPRRLRAAARKLLSTLHIHADSVDTACGLLSGGNQQKVVLAKWLAAEPTVLLLDDPTRGVDVGGKSEIHALLRSVATDSIVLLCSTDLDELAAVCDRVLVLYRGAVCATLTGSRINQHDLLHAMNTGAA
ncbi:sugar ABC transporter ATP-binding protein [Nocardia panacis]|uniref:Sugar ABC transporter ATP-binding protein n=1 Tax=Nocardia panacis TaxID=2340916 RepID=A0A3A4L840_9NOCA|nr:sugar ABC transporter ATP-binding protein [Nocardia panacis]RJO79211.1 sugar ABC transporter ATP-binding protein [Nocardia panacis]